jgi:hypothetical protein
MKYGWFMVFGWGKKKTPPPVEAVVRIRLEEAPGIAEEVQAKRSQNIVTEASNILHSTNDMIRELTRIRQDLERDDLDMDDVDKRMRPLVTRGKRMLVDALRKNAVEIEPIRAPDDMARAAGELEHRLKRLGNILGKQSRVIHIFAERYALRLKQILEEVEANRKSMLGLSGRHQADSGVANAVVNGEANVRALEDSARENAQKHDAAEAEARRLDTRMAQLTSEMARFRESDGYMRLLELRRDLKGHEDAKSRLSSEIAARFTSISRPLGRYERVSADKEQTALLLRVQQNPYDVMNRREVGAVMSLLEGVRRAVASGSISVKDVDKANEAITKTGESIEEYVDKVEGTEADIRRTQEMIVEAEPVRLHDMESEMASLQESKETAVRRAAETMAAVNLSVRSIPAEVAEVQRALLRLTGTKYNITYEGPGPK